MKPKVARRFLRRNWIKIARHNLGMGRMCPSMKGRVWLVTRTLLKEK